MFWLRGRKEFEPPTKLGWMVKCTIVKCAGGNLASLSFIFIYLPEIILSMDLFEEQICFDGSSLFLILIMYLHGVDSSTSNLVRTCLFSVFACISCV